MSAQLRFLRARCMALIGFSFLMTAASDDTYGQSGRQKGKPTFTVRLMNLESAAKDPFRYSATLNNASGRTQVFELGAMAPAGWTSVFRVDGSQVAGLRLDSGRVQEISLEITAAPAAKPGKYKVPVLAVSDSDTLRLELEAVVKGNYGLELSTPTGRLSDDITEGSKKRIELTVKNTGTLPLEDLEPAAQAPVNWSATFEPSKIDRLEPGQTKTLTATLNVPDKTIAGDYVTNFTAKNEAASSTATFRMTVKTSLLSGWLGILVILLSLGIVYYLIRKYGRR